MQTVADLMTRNLLTITTDHTMKNVHDLINKRGIRHIPIMDAGNTKMVALVTQKVMISKVISLLTEFGAEHLLEKEMQTPVMNFAITDFDKVNENLSLKDAASYFLDNKNGCLPVFNDQEQLVGMLSSSDFVKLSLQLLE